MSRLTCVGRRVREEVEVRTCEADETELEGKRFSPREAQNWAARLYLMIFYLSALFRRTGGWP